MRELLELLEHDARRPVGELASMLNRSEYEVEKNIKDLEKNKIILSYNTLINWEKFGDDTVTAMIEINLTPQREVGFDAIAERIYRFDEVRTVYLMSGSFDLMVIPEGSSQLCRQTPLHHRRRHADPQPLHVKAIQKRWHDYRR